MTGISCDSLATLFNHLIRAPAFTRSSNNSLFSLYFIPLGKSYTSRIWLTPENQERQRCYVKCVIFHQFHFRSYGANKTHVCPDMNASIVSEYFMSYWVYSPGGGGVLPKKLGRGVRPASQNPYPIYDQNLRFSLPYL